MQSQFSISKPRHAMPIQIPPELTLTATDMASGDRRFIVHAQQLLPQMGHSKTEYHVAVTLEESAPVKRIFNVHGGRVLELCLAQFWSSLGPCVLSADIQFHGLLPGMHDRARPQVQKSNLCVSREST